MSDAQRTGCTLVLVRHGRTVYNEQGRLQGWSDSPLTEAGLRQVRATALALADARIDAAYASPSPRTVTTAEEVLAAHPQVALETVDGIREFHFGDYEARPEPELFASVPAQELFPAVLAGTFAGLPGGESTRGYLDRVRGAFRAIEQRHDDGATVLVVSHGITLLAYLVDLVGQAELRPLANASVSVVHVRRGRRRLAAFGIDPSAGEPIDAAVLADTSGDATLRRL